MKKADELLTIDQFEAKYFPKAYERKVAINQPTSAVLGESLISDLLSSVKSFKK